MATETMDAAVVHELTYVLLLELLSYQFCSPVRWIETQHVIFGDLQIERLIEIGPSGILTGMAQKTISSSFTAQDAATSTRRQLLCSKTDTKDIYYEFDVPEAENPASSSQAKIEPTTEATVSTESAILMVPSTSVPSTSTATATATKILDIPISAAEIVKSIVAIALRISPKELSFSKSIKELAAGRSSLQNEIIGDLSKEFDELPTTPEDISLDELCSSIQSTFRGDLGKYSISSTARMISSKMPAGCGPTVIRNYLKDNWGLEAGRQDVVLMSALPIQPDHRLGSVEEMSAFWDGVAQKYIDENGLLRPTNPQSSGNGSGEHVVVNTKTLEILKKDQTILNKRLLELYAKQLNIDLSSKGQQLEQSEKHASDLQKELDVWMSEHGEPYSLGIRPMFQPLKARLYDSYWNWARQDVIQMFHSLINSPTKTEQDMDLMIARIVNRSTSELVDLIRYLIRSIPRNLTTTRVARETMQSLLRQCEFSLNRPAIFKAAYKLPAPQTIVDANGKIVYSEIPRAEDSSHRTHAAKPSQILSTNGVKEKVHSVAVNGYTNGYLIPNETNLIVEHKGHRAANTINGHRTTNGINGYTSVNGHTSVNGYTSVNGINPYGNTNGTNGYSSINKANGTKVPNNHLAPEYTNGVLSSDVFNKDSLKLANGYSHNNHTSEIYHELRGKALPLVYMCRKSTHGWEHSESWTECYQTTLNRAVSKGLSFSQKNVLLTGAGKGSIGFKLLEGLLSGGAKVIVTTSNFSPDVVQRFQQLYMKHGGKDSQMVVVPCNLGSQKDVISLLSYIYDSHAGLGWDLDHIIPFAAISENGRELENIDSTSELAHRIMLTNTLRLLGETKLAKARIRSRSRPAQVILPLSPNHGILGNDGLYSESKLSLESLFNKWYSESWNEYLCICGASIGWTRGTGLMSSVDIVSEGVEKAGVRTFSQEEMAGLILALMAPDIIDICQLEPIYANLSGKMDSVSNIKEVVTDVRKRLLEESEISRAIAEERLLEEQVIHGKPKSILGSENDKVNRRPNIKFDFPKLPDYNADLKPLNAQLSGIVDLEKVVVAVGFSEIGPYGNARTRWDMEAYGEFSLEGCIEMAWIMGLIKHRKGLVNGKQYCGWVDVKTGDPVAEIEVKKKYEKFILENSGIRLVDPVHKDASGSYSVQVLQEVIIEDDLDPMEVSEETAQDFRREHGQMVEILRDEDASAVSVRFKKGASLMIPKAMKVDPTVAGLIPTGWDPRTYGINENVISQVDPGTIFALVSTVEALLSAGITDPYEFYQYIHVSELGNCLGSGVGGTESLRKIFKGRYLEKPIQHDILQESFINTTGAWINMLLLSSSGPIRTPVGACATALESLETAYELIVAEKAKVVLAGGHDNIIEEVSHEFRNMKATVDTKDEFARGRTPREMSRPATSTRSGFVESHGCGIQVLTSAKLALDMGLPIYGVIGFTTTASDNMSRSIPAAGKGILTAAREKPAQFPSPLLNIQYRRRRLDLRKNEIQEGLELELAYLEEEVKKMDGKGGSILLTQYYEERKMDIKREAQNQEKEAVRTFGNNFWINDTRISPIRGALAVWGLTIDDLNVASFHGTSTMQSEKNESSVIHDQLSHLGRQMGNPILAVFQKHLTGHPKGAAGAWMLNGAMQMLDSGLVPGNRNADNIDAALRVYDNIVFPHSSTQTAGINAVSVTAFGFGQKGSQAIVVHPKFLFATVDQECYFAYSAKVNARHKKAYRCFHEGIAANNMYKENEKSPYDPSDANMYRLDPTARLPR